MKNSCHLSEEMLVKFGNGTILSKREFRDVCSHLESCEDCLTRLEAMGTDDDPLIRRLRVTMPSDERRLFAPQKKLQDG